MYALRRELGVLQGSKIGSRETREEAVAVDTARDTAGVEEGVSRVDNRCGWNPLVGSLFQQVLPTGLAVRLQGKEECLLGFGYEQIKVLLLNWGRNRFGM